MYNIKIFNAGKDDLKEVFAVFSNAFVNEGISSYIFDFSKKKSKKVFSRLNMIIGELYLAEGNQILAAKSENKIVGSAILAKDYELSDAELFKHILSKDIALLASVLCRLNFIRAYKVHKASKKPDKLPDKFMTLDMLAVDPAYQNQSIGTQLLNKVHKIAEESGEYKGVYLITGEKENEELYQYFGYKTIEVKKASKLNIYHMFRENSN
ncbi:GNAT family N-acetyltransferase [Halanaerobium sp. Z-7514]|uniref:GNAT family N-acetyltransferase n=1 Tax=Halanaerobium polyolivorans TaxID=2886943 RepID=A0AAW4WSL7_9FIRM|nr:GNAT family N-acetyltransferase [Halanaerobium polyolivorans]MCC3144006.1 GNAT family N-acetyltransferase [Halanaerobium polyolivorans]